MNNFKKVCGVSMWIGVGFMCVGKRGSPCLLGKHVGRGEEGAGGP